MKRNLLAILFSVAGTATINNANAQSTLLYFWDFNTFSTSISLPAIASLAADYGRPGLDTAKARWVFQPNPAPGPVAGYCDNWTTIPSDGDTVNENWPSVPSLPLSVVSPASNNNCFRARNPNDSMEILMYMPTPNFTNLVLSYGVESSSTNNGDSLNIFSYSVDSGTTWVTSGSGLSAWYDTVADYVTFTLIRVNITDPATYNNPKFVFRIQLFRGSNYDGGTGNNRFDNVSLQADTAMPALGVNQLKNVEPSYTLYPNPATNQLNVNANMDGDKSVVITNIIGQTVFSETENGTHFPINTAELNTGIYYMAIRENNTGSVTTMKFIKQ